MEFSRTSFFDRRRPRRYSGFSDVLVCDKKKWPFEFAGQKYWRCTDR